MSGEQASWRDALSKSISNCGRISGSQRVCYIGENSGEPNRSLDPKMKSVDRVEWMQLVPRWTMLVNTSCVYTKLYLTLYYHIHTHVHHRTVHDADFIGLTAELRTIRCRNLSNVIRNCN